MSILDQFQTKANTTLDTIEIYIYIAGNFFGTVVVLEFHFKPEL